MFTMWERFVLLEKVSHRFSLRSWYVLMLIYLYLHKHTNMNSDVFSYLIVTHVALKQSTMSFSVMSTSNSDIFYRDLCEAFLAANIPLWKFTSPTLKAYIWRSISKNIHPKKVHFARTMFTKVQITSRIKYFFL